ncbi:MAG: integrase domain-containing protein [Aliarcobacter butzleri]|nr:integrase domain-containing protein [Aliarcobacter butzleri]
MFNAKRASANSVINRVLSNANGVGTSKSQARNNSGLKGQNGHKISDKAHSIKELQNLRTVTTQYVNFVKENYQGKVASNINAESARAFIASKAQTVASSTLNTYISTMNKVVDNLAKDNIGSLQRNDIKDIKQDFNTSKNHENRAYENVESIKEAMRDTTMSISSDLQAEAGLRADDAINSSKWTINNDNTITINGSKGGIEYTTRALSDETIQRAREAQENGYKANYTEYREALREAVISTNQDYNGTHGLRYNFAQERVEELKNNGYSEDEAKAQTSLEMGHSRIDITNHYTSF